MLSYNEAISYIGSIPWTKRKPGLHRMRILMDMLGNPQDRLKFIHVAGTNGKGSACAMLASVFKEAGYRTGLFTSPHLIKYNERMKINGADIDDEEFARLISDVSEAAGKMEEGPSEFEILTAAGFLWFYEKKCDIVILEVGLGGELDSTNVISAKELALIMPIGYDHTAILGDDIKNIAGAKAGIITENVDVVMAFQNNPAEISEKKEVTPDSLKIESVIRNRCAKKNAFLHVPDAKDFELISSDIEGQIFKNAYTDAPVFLRLSGAYQRQNALAVLEAIKVIKSKDNGFVIEEQHILDGLRNVKWNARFEVLNRNPVFILDGAHNDHGIKAAVKSLKDIYPDKKIIYILGILSDKNIEEMLEELYTNAERFITLTPDSGRALSGDILAERIREAGFEAESLNNTEEAIIRALELCMNRKNDFNDPADEGVI